MKKYVVYYTDNKLEEGLDLAVRAQILSAAKDIEVISVSQVPMDFGHNICVGRKPRTYLSMYEQLLTGLEAAEEDSIIYLCEHDVFYHPDYFEFDPGHRKVIFFNLHRFYWKLGLDTFWPSTGKRALSQGVAYREIWMEHAKQRIEAWRNGNSTFMEGPFMNWATLNANIDIRHGGNFSAENTDKDSYLKGGMKGAEGVPGWGTAEDLQRATGYRNPKFGTDNHLVKMFGGRFENPVKAHDFFREDLAKLFYELDMTRGAEIGVKWGDYSVRLIANNPHLTLKLVDDWGPYKDVSWDNAEKNFVHAKTRMQFMPVDIIRKTSVQAANVTPKNSLDFVYIDASHDFNDVMRDIILWSDRVRCGGIVSGHDYGGDDHSVKLAVDAYVKAHGIKLYVTDTKDVYPDSVSSWFFAKADL